MGTTIPVGIWVKRIPVETLLTFCPPAPLERKYPSWFLSDIYFDGIVSNSGMTSRKKEAIRTSLSQTEIRTKRELPFWLEEAISIWPFNDRSPTWSRFITCLVIPNLNLESLRFAEVRWHPKDTSPQSWALVPPDPGESQGGVRLWPRFRRGKGSSAAGHHLVQSPAVAARINSSRTDSSSAKSLVRFQLHPAILPSGNWLIGVFFSSFNSATSLHSDNIVPKSGSVISFSKMATSLF